MKRPLRRSRSLKVTDFGTSRKLLYDFLLVINANLPPIWGDPLPISPWMIHRQKLDSLAYIFAAESICVSSITFNAPYVTRMLFVGAGMTRD